jgi:hypothetical protein
MAQASADAAGHRLDAEPIQPLRALRRRRHAVALELAQQLPHEQRVASRAVVACHLELGGYAIAQALLDHGRDG